MVRERNTLNVQGEKKMVNNVDISDIEFDEIIESKKIANEIIKNLGGESFLIENDAKNICFDRIGIEFLVKYSSNRRLLDDPKTHHHPTHMLITINKHFRSRQYKVKLEGLKRKRTVSIRIFENIEPSDLKYGIKNQMGIPQDIKKRPDIKRTRMRFPKIG